MSKKNNFDFTLLDYLTDLYLILDESGNLNALQVYFGSHRGEDYDEIIHKLPPSVYKYIEKMGLDYEHEHGVYAIYPK